MLRDGGLLAVEGFEGFFGEGFEGFFGEGIERLGFLGDRVLKGGEVGGEGDKEVGAFGENGFLRFEFIMLTEFFCATPPPNPDLSTRLKSLWRKVDTTTLLRSVVSKLNESTSLGAEIATAMEEAVDPVRLVEREREK
ncbi:hypothetical protein JHK82_040815 [Glycine max]|nr:hypothetical protein JHK86_041021 [Glycine max]KAG4966656.1 hypothetical protein JHK85_041631 [Glycine max]KAG5111592.1 hypothetical protein JHK82_040815 [Glycine max]KAG5122887.1 hypothetical protein JHK84_041227 [Glycine max]